MKSSVFIGFFAALISAVAARTTPGDKEQGNSIIKPGLNEQVEAGKPYEITWVPSSKDTVSLILLRGPSSNVKPLETIVEGIANEGTYSWTPGTGLEADETGYGLMLIEDTSGDYRYSTQFGITNSAKPVDDDIDTEKPIDDDKDTEEPVDDDNDTEEPVESPSHNTTMPEVKPEEMPSVVYSTHVATVTDCGCGKSEPTGETPIYGNSTIVSPEPTETPTYGNETVPEYVAPVSPVDNTTSPEPPLYTGAAAQFKVGGAFVAVVAGMVFALF